MTKEEAKKYIKGRQLEIVCELELPKKEKWKERLSREYNFLHYVSNVIAFSEDISGLTDECDVLPAPSIFEYKGYILQQSNYNNHYMIFKDGQGVCHCQCTEKLDQKKAEEHIDFYLDLIKENNDE